MRDPFPQVLNRTQNKCHILSDPQHHQLANTSTEAKEKAGVCAPTRITDRVTPRPHEQEWQGSCGERPRRLGRRESGARASPPQLPILHLT